MRTWTRTWTWLVLAAAGCDDTLFTGGEGGGSTTVTADGGWCAVQTVLASSCLSCHSAAGAVAGLDLQTDPHATLLAGYVVAGDPAGSLLYRKVSGETGAGDGGVMPPSGALTGAALEAVRAWIADGADDVCDAPPTGTTVVTYHPEGWAAASVHGLGAKLGDDDCRTCHGADLAGGDVGIACGDCHPAGWQTTCTFCHGDPATDQPAPPQDIDDNDDPATISFPEHANHTVDTALHLAFDCALCHAVPTDALTPGHLFDDATPGRAEVALGGVAAGGSYAAGSCTVSCHGDARQPGTITSGDAIACGGCHAVSQFRQLSDPHERHIDEGIGCQECHGTVSSAPYEILPAQRAQHLDGDIDLTLPAGMTRSGETCSGTCHGETHNGRHWVD
ncbi:MAG: c-type cytochrome domain-containing protein [Myxococcota bacterium]